MIQKLPNRSVRLSLSAFCGYFTKIFVLLIYYIIEIFKLKLHLGENLISKLFYELDVST